jgi:pSer/pThr/pTyr-binding forkhead associated (FHA) protein
MDAKLIVVEGKANKDEIALKLPTIIGRGKDAGLTVAHPMVSRQHCEVYEANGLLMIRDLGSLNGTKWNDQSVKEAPLPPGETFTVGPLTFRAEYAYDGDLNQLPKPVLAEPKTESAAKTATTNSSNATAKTATSDPNAINETVPLVADPKSGNANVELFDEILEVGNSGAAPEDLFGTDDLLPIEDDILPLEEEPPAAATRAPSATIASPAKKSPGAMPEGFEEIAETPATEKKKPKSSWLGSMFKGKKQAKQSAAPKAPEAAAEPVKPAPEKPVAKKPSAAPQPAPKKVEEADLDMDELFTSSGAPAAEDDTFDVMGIFADPEDEPKKK